MTAPVTEALPKADVTSAPRFALEPLATEALIEAAPTSINPSGLRAEILPLYHADGEPASALLARVEDPAGAVVHEWPYSTASWCIAEWAKAHGSRITAAPSSLSRDPASRGSVPGTTRYFSLPAVRQVRLTPLLTGALVYGRPGFCPAVFEHETWQVIETIFRDALPNEALVVLRGSLCQDPESGTMFSLIDGVATVNGRSAPDAVSGTAAEVADALAEEPGRRFVGMGHSHPTNSQQGKVVISRIDLETFRLRLRSAHMVSLIANVAPSGPIEAIVLSWTRGGVAAVGFYVAANQAEEVDQNGREN